MTGIDISIEIENRLLVSYSGRVGMRGLESDSSLFNMMKIFYN